MKKKSSRVYDIRSCVNNVKKSHTRVKNSMLGQYLDRLVRNVPGAKSPTLLIVSQSITLILGKIQSVINCYLKGIIGCFHCRIHRKLCSFRTIGF